MSMSLKLDFFTLLNLIEWYLIFEFELILLELGMTKCTFNSSVGDF